MLGLLMIVVGVILFGALLAVLGHLVAFGLELGNSIIERFKSKREAEKNKTLLP